MYKGINNTACANRGQSADISSRPQHVFSNDVTTAPLESTRLRYNQGIKEEGQEIQSIQLTAEVLHKDVDPLKGIRYIRII